MPAVKTHFQDLPVALDPAQLLEIAHQHFDVCALPIQQQLFAWCDRMIGVVDLLTTRDAHGQPFRGWIDRYAVGEFLFADCYVDRITQDRTIARISQDNARSAGLAHISGMCACAHVRLRAAAAELVAWPGVQVQDIAYAHGFKSASDFTRAFRRAYGLAPQDIRQYGDGVRTPPKRS
ncbi:helix-turn-helix domain-containing protein [Paraburkholderia phymatum]|uniref:helix-turn-helix domain-containing protein n=1 Tax=Paraburkholderia phymatum TaxID=148447 RepID=UPI003172F5A0